MKLPRRQFSDKCGKSTTETLLFIEFYRRHTKRYEEYICQRVITTNIDQVGRENNLNIKMRYWEYLTTLVNSIKTKLATSPSRQYR